LTKTYAEMEISVCTRRDRATSTKAHHHAVGSPARGLKPKLQQAGNAIAYKLRSFAYDVSKEWNAEVDRRKAQRMERMNAQAAAQQEDRK
jgi:hypothetical protein